MASPSLAVAVEQWNRLWKKNPTATNGNRGGKRQKKNKRLTTKKTTRIHVQPTLYSFLDKEKCAINPSGGFGDDPLDRPQASHRIGFYNLHNLSKYRNDEKLNQIFATIQQYSFDALMMAEIGVCWQKIETNSQWDYRVDQRFQHKSVFSNNVNELKQTEPLQWGGTGITAINDLSTSVISKGRDPSGLGRWSWLLIEGKQHYRTRLISVYRPCHSETNLSGVYLQHRRYFGLQGQDREPREALLEDLYCQIEQWKTDGDQIVVGGDFNEDVRSSSIQSMFRALDMREVILGLHKRQGSIETCNTNEKGTPIDGIFATEGIEILQAGYFPYIDSISDHRLLWVDISNESFMGIRNTKLIKAEPKRLKLEDPFLLRRYQERVAELLEKTGVLSRLLSLSQTAQSTGWSPQLTIEYNHLHSLNTKIRFSVEQKIRKLRMGAIPWSPTLQQHINAITMWRLLIKRKQNKHYPKRKLRRLLKHQAITDAFDLSLDSLKQQLTDAWAAYKTVKNEAVSLRQEFLQDLAQRKASVSGLSVETELRKLKHIQWQKRTSTHIKWMRDKLGQNATTKVFVTENGIRRMATDKEDIEEVCMNENEARFSQSEDTPPMQPPLIQILGLMAENVAAEQILNGTWIPPDGVDQYATKLLLEMKRPPIVSSHGDLPNTIPLDDHVQGWRRQNERTSSTPTGLHFGHYKAGAEHISIATCDAILRSLPYQFGFAPEAWKDIVNVEILKKAGVYDIEKMRTITLMHAEFNMNNKKLGRDLMHFAHKNGTIAPEQYGSRPAHQAIMVPLNKRLTMDLSRYHKRPTALCSNDAKSCYDRIVHNVAILAMRRQGAPLSAVNSMFSTLQQASHRIRTAYGDSDRSFGRRPTPLQGVGQGNGCGPTCWAMVSTPLIAMMRTANFGFKLVSALSLMAIHLVCYAFVDDTDVVHTCSNPNATSDQLTQEMQDVVDHWEGGLRATGGGLRADKSYWYLVDYQWKNNKWCNKSIADAPGNITVRDASGERVALERCEVSEARETIGVFLAMDGNFRTQVEQLRAKAALFADCVRSRRISKTEIWIAIHTTIMKTLEYPMVAVSLTMKQWNYILAPVLKHALPRTGLVRTFPRAILFGPKEFGGLGWMHPFHKQYLLQLQVPIREFDRQTVTSSLITACFEAAKLESGFNCSSPHWDSKILNPILTESWLTALLQYCQHHGLSLQDTAADLQSSTSKDLFIMEEVVKAGYRKSDLMKINFCRMALRVINLSDIACADLRSINPDFLRQRSPHTRWADLAWPRQPETLPSAWWKVWSDAIQRVFCLNPLQSLALQQDIGHWETRSIQQWTCFWSSSQDRLFVRSEEWRVWPRYRSNRRSARRRQFKQSSLQVLEPPADAIPVDIILHGPDLASLRSHATTGSNDSGSTEPHSFVDRFQAWPDDDKWCIERLRCSDDGMSLASAIAADQTIISISDGSFDPTSQKGTSGFMLRTPDGTASILGANRVPGLPHEQCSFRSELAGVSGALTAAQLCCDTHGIAQGRLLIVLDGLQVIKSLQGHLKHGSLPDPTDSNYDMLYDTLHKIRKLPLSTSFQWIKAHQDDHLRYDELPPLAQNNCDMDRLAKDYMKATADRPHWTQRLRYHGFNVLLRGHYLSRIDIQYLYAAIWKPTVSKYWIEKFTYSEATFNDIYWEGIASCFRSFTWSQHRKIVKFATGHMGVGTKLVHWKFQDHDECPRCDQPEDNQHVLKCTSVRAVSQAKYSISQLETWMRGSTDPRIRWTIIDGIKQFVFGQYRHDILPPRARLAQQNQARIGWFQLLMGFISKSWLPLQEEYLVRTHSKTNTRRWASMIIQKLMQIAWDMWADRNDAKHNDRPSVMIRYDSSLVSEIDEILGEEPPYLLPADQHLLRIPMATLHAYSTTFKELWLNSVRGARETFLIHTHYVSHGTRLQQQLMKNWLLPPPDQSDSSLDDFVESLDYISDDSSDYTYVHEDNEDDSDSTTSTSGT